MKYLLALGFLGMASADYYCPTVNDLVDFREIFHKAYCPGSEGTVALAVTSEENFADLYLCAQPSGDVCPPGWKRGTEDQFNGNYCYLVVVPNLPDDICKDPNGDFCPDGQSPSNGVCARDEGMVNSHTVLGFRDGISCTSGENGCSFVSPSHEWLDSQNCGTDNSLLYTSDLCVNECAGRCFGYFDEKDTLGVIIVAPPDFELGLAPGCWCTTTLISSTNITEVYRAGTVQVDVSKAATDNSGSAASDPCTADPYDKDACCATKVLASEYIDAQCCNCN